MVKLLSLSAIEPLLTIKITLLNGYSFKNIMQMTANFAVVGCSFFDLDRRLKDMAC